jgi:uncharacterized OB-fold protein
MCSTAAVPELQDLTMTLEYPYTRTTGPVVGPFLTGLRDGKILANRSGDRVLLPPLEYDPDTGASLEPDLVEVGPGGTVGAWTWVETPTRKHPFTHPFAFALITVDGADTPFVHVVDAGSIDEMATGMRVKAQYRDERKGAITDLYFVPEADAKQQTIKAGEDPVTITEHLIGVTLSEPLFPHRARFAKGLLEGRIIGQKSPVSGMVYVPGRGYDNLERVLLTEADEVVVADVGTVTSFTVITPVQYYGQKETEPYIRCSLLLDGADQPIIGVDVRDIAAEDFRIGLRLKAVWKPLGERSIDEMDNRFGASWEDVIARWEPTGEPDVPFEQLTDHNW